MRPLPMSSLPPRLAVAVVGGEADGTLAAALSAAGLVVDAGAAVVVVGGPVAARATLARVAVAGGLDVFVAWPPGSAAEAQALLALADEAGVEVGVERPLAADLPLGPVRLASVSVVFDGAPEAWPRRLAGALDVAARLAGTPGAARLDAEAERDGTALRAVAVTVRFRNGAFAHVLVRAVAGGSGLVVYAAGVETALPLDEALGAEAAAFARAVRDGRRAPYGLHDALATMRLTERVMAALR